MAVTGQATLKLLLSEIFPNVAPFPALFHVMSTAAVPTVCSAAAEFPAVSVNISRKLYSVASSNTTVDVSSVVVPLEIVP